MLHPSQWGGPPLPLAVCVDLVWAKGHVGRAHPFLAPHFPLPLVGQPEGMRHGQRLAEREDMLRASFDVAGP